LNVGQAYAFAFLPFRIQFSIITTLLAGVFMPYIAKKKRVSLFSKTLFYFYRNDGKGNLTTGHFSLSQRPDRFSKPVGSDYQRFTNIKISAN
jgi:hypothetical protein